ncbi:MAG: DNA-binding protein WhiA [Lachnospiraceae bacterium]|nr:DNA-binding protein WhiA [Lachnospiraceae bacterium]
MIQIKDIEFLRDTVGLGSLPEELAETAALRIANPEATLSELGEMLNPPLGRSGVNHRLQKLCNLAEQSRRIL